MAPGALVQDHVLPAGNRPESQQTEADAPSPNLFSLSGQTIAITGGGRGLGITLAIAVVEAGANVACLDVLPEPSAAEWKRLQGLAKKTGLSATYDRCDITNEAEVIQTLETVDARSREQRAPFSGLIACAGIQQKTPAVDYPVEDFQRMLNVNVTGTFITAKQATKIFIKNQVKGSIVLIASMSGQVANRGLDCTAYNTSKAAVHQMCRSMAQEIGQHGIRINTLSPGYIRTAMTDALLEIDPDLKDTWMRGALLGRLGAPEDFKAPAVFLLASGSSFMTGSDLRVDGGHCASA
ncbi:hypothetical protein CLAFUW4_07888 [Fulvia fulva]|uniref:Short chain dehydrogenases/reductase n=1 Tax=Passalora fulva TaxID=5499 RepID=A0A9Q8P6Y0_PASFU|nr:Short chain dehydrogenases/reductase [Fulvia fulva]KAK4628828.1 hypothetical protein CLAFUR4_07893 [Fulvia fulva]KAK4630553.1 hypothetical protein CLAFUR0_07890 [Fulvia fulva]UJO15302.1 Short chain dehydrogenases/reductase [Fulvia fulva]WPV12931.1 hypothetical protein CLAFUW4_07888 [Fulvia fulva]WPV27793.1 hypothetical protein CLAFUW7_07889 [Fulvia fulva]